MTARATVTACLIVLDEERLLPGALESVAFCDQIVVVDSGSTDRTREIAREAGAIVVEHPWQGFAVQRNVAIDHATGDWILEVDADERITPALAVEIRAFLDSDEFDHDIVALPMRHEFLGGWLGPAIKYPFYRYRLFRRGVYRHDERRTVHEGLWAHTPAWAMRHDMEHELAPTLRAALVDLRSYTRLEASQFRPARTPRTVVVGVLVRPAVKVAYRLVVDRAWRDGWRGLLKVALDAVGDAGVWLLALRRGTGGDAETAHFSGDPVARGPLRLVGVATEAADTGAVAAWLEQARAHGADATLLTCVPDTVRGDRAPGDGPDRTPSGIRLRPLESGSVLGVVRGLDAERQVRQIDALVVPDRGLGRVTARAVGRVARHPPVPVSTAVPQALDSIAATRPDDGEDALGTL